MDRGANQVRLRDGPCFQLNARDYDRGAIRIRSKLVSQDSLALRSDKKAYLRIEIPLQQDQCLQATDRHPEIRFHGQGKLKEFLMRWEILQWVWRRFICSHMHSFVVDCEPTQSQDKVNRAQEPRIGLWNKRNGRWGRSTSSKG